MDSSTATPQPARGSRKGAQSAARAQARLITLLAVGLVVFGAVLQRFVPPGPVSVVLYTTTMTAALVAAAYAMRGVLLDALASFRLAAVTLSALAIASALGTLVLQGKPLDFYKAHYGAAALPVMALRLDDLFHTLWFGGLVALMNAGLITSALRRWPINRRNAGFFAVHVGILVTLAGAGLSAVFSVKGRVDLRVGQAASTAVVTRSGLPTTKEVPLGAAIHLSRFDVDRWAEVPRLGLYVPKKEGGGYKLKTTFENEVGVKHRLPRGASVRIKAFYPDFVMTERLVEGQGDQAALKLRLDGQDTFLVSGKRARLDSKDGKLTVLFGWQRPAARVDAPLHTIKGSKGEARPVRLGEKVALEDGTRVTALRFFPHFTFDIGRKQAMNVSDTPVNPALEVEIEAGGSEGGRRWLFANMPGFGHGKEGPALTYAFAPEGGSAAGTVVAVGAADRSVLVRRADGTEETLALADGLEVEGARFGALVEKASLVQEPSTTSQELKNAAVMVEVVGPGAAGAREVLMVAGQKDPVQVGNAYLTFETRGADVKAFRSEILIRSGAEERKEIVAVNSPVSVGPWKLYQVNYDPKDPKYSGLEAVRDPGVTWVFAGFGLLFFGVAYMIYVAPRMPRKKEGA